MIAINTTASNTLATDIILALNELQERVETQGVDQFVVNYPLILRALTIHTPT